jgi:hypothetical protein
MYIMMIAQHSPESCPKFNPDTFKTAAPVMQALLPTLAKHDVKLVGSWEDPAAHTGWTVLESPSFDTYLAAVREPALDPWLSFHTVESRVVLSLDETMTMVQAMMQGR